MFFLIFSLPTKVGKKGNIKKNIKSIKVRPQGEDDYEDKGGGD